MAAKTGPYSEIDYDRLRKIIGWHKSAIDADRAQQRSFEDAFSMAAGHQWTQEELDALEADDRAALTYNFLHPYIKFITGTLQQNRIRPAAEPNEQNDQFLADLLNDAVNWIDERNLSVDAEDEAAEDAATCGRGFVAVDVVTDPERPDEILLTETNVPVREIRIDSMGRRIFWHKWVTREDFKIQYPDFANKIDEVFDTGDISSVDVSSGDTSDEPLGYLSDSDNQGRYSDYFEDGSGYHHSDGGGPLDPEYYDKDKDLLRIVHCEYWETYWRYYVRVPGTEETREIPEEKVKAFKNLFRLRYGSDPDMTRVRDKRVRWYQFTGHFVLFDDLSPMPFKGFSIVHMFAYVDKSGKVPRHFGLGQLLKDPIRESNKRYSQTLDLIASQGQGVMAEIDAFVNIKQAEDTWNNPRRITFLNKGALAQGKVREKPRVEVSSSLISLREINKSDLKQISGINPDLMGQDRGRQDPGIVIQLRQRQGMVILESLLKNYRRMLRELFKRKAAIIMRYMPDKQLVRILGSSDKYRIVDGIVYDMENRFTANIRDLRNLEYNIRIEDAPSNTTKRANDLGAYLDLMGKGFPVDPHVIVKKMDLSAGDRAAWLKYIDETQQSRSSEAQARQQLEAEKIRIQDERAKMSHTVDVMRVMQAEKDSVRDFNVALSRLNADDRARIIDLVMRMTEDRAQKLLTDTQQRPQQPPQQLPPPGTVLQ